MNVSGIVAELIEANAPAHAAIAGRVYPGVAKQETAFPCVVVNLVAPNPNNTKTKASDLDLALVQVDVYGQTYTSAASTSALVRTALDYKSGTVSLTGGGSASVAHIEYKQERDGFVERPDIFRRICEYTISLRR